MSDGRPRLLYLAYFFPPCPAIGCVRTWNTAKRLTDLGWAVTVVTLRPNLWRDPEEPDKVEVAIADAGFKRILTDHEWRMLMPGYTRWIPGRVVVVAAIAGAPGIAPLTARNFCQPRQAGLVYGRHLPRSGTALCG